MARYTGAVCRICRRQGMKLYLKGERCYTPKCAVERRGYPPGMHGQSRRKMSDYGLQLREKQKMRRIYGILERPFRRYFKAAERSRGVTGDALLQYLERRLDNVVFRLGLASSRNQARQMVAHRLFTVNGRRVSIPSHQVRVGDVVEVVPARRQSALILNAMAQTGGRRIPSWLEFNPNEMRAQVISVPARDEIDTPVQEQLVVEYYSR
ncbi:30S ribosomal protein S4 [candidate division KD3-62 bacterium DG_56]|uniref:Small ribosomal subunit protein uS4 n=1 Tax=candidate division KD3-62 bacterium DG_56 TaxID=1704032 RepID=A0A0S7XJI9_9BACT|nr:MAG: 30S ribosomal protein S4 [candidate division KD3-62 bacterium DG_56]